jgi:hypothetical protein
MKPLKSVTFNLTCTIFATLLWAIGISPASSILVGLLFDTVVTICFKNKR